MHSKQSFEDAPRVEDQERLLPKSDADSTSVAEGESWQPTSFRTSRQSKRRSFIAALRDYWWLYSTILLIAIVGLQLVIWHDIRAGSQECSRQIGGDYNNEGPIFTTEVTQWKANPDFVPLNATAFLDPKIRAKWETLYPPGAAFVGGPNSDDIYNTTSVTHQLHCAYVMGKIFSAVLTKSPNIPEPDSYEAYFLTCVDYIRQAAMCAGDVAIEPRGTDGKPAPVSHENSFNGLHVCKDYSQVKAYLTEQVKDGARNIMPLDDW
ncbi:hypothetical protein BX600DRAFT_464383 [Xylariales sp. PMI_506]|nr:hypothetical protein BX600DRAFT_464383 [Xylariales sp. PMI_506]